MLLAMVVVLVIGTSSLGAQDWMSRAEDEHAVYAELLGKGLLFSVYYERMLHPTLGINGGVSFWPEYLAVPVFISWYPSEGVHSPFLEAGVRMRITTEEHRREVAYDGYRVMSYEMVPTSRLNGLLGVGYSYRSRTDDILFKIGGVVFIGELGTMKVWNPRYWGGIGIGFTF